MNLDLQTRIERSSTPEPNSGCWLWDGVLSTAGYGTTCVNGKQTSTHRASYAAFFGEIPEGKLVRHQCDTKSCVNPQHLVLGTHRDNAIDRAKRGRSDGSTPEQRHAWCSKGGVNGSWGLGLDLKGRLDRLSIFEPNTGCQLWLGTVTKSTGYGEIKVNHRKTTAHRAMWVAHRGEIPSGLVVMHKCDIRTCVNIDHLSIGSRKQNSADMSKKGRGSFNKLTHEQCLERSKRALLTMGEEGRKARTAIRIARMTPEQRSAIAAKKWTPEYRAKAHERKPSQATRDAASAGLKAFWAKLSAEERTERAKRRAANVPFEKHSERSQKMWANMSLEARAEHSRKVSEGRRGKKTKLILINLFKDLQ